MIFKRAAKFTNNYGNMQKSWIFFTLIFALSTEFMQKSRSSSCHGAALIESYGLELIIHSE